MSTSRVVVDIRTLRLDFQSPECLDEEVVQAKMAQIDDGQAFEPLDVRFDGGDSYILADGFHRVEAARRRGVL